MFVYLHLFWAWPAWWLKHPPARPGSEGHSHCFWRARPSVCRHELHLVLVRLHCHPMQANKYKVHCKTRAWPSETWLGSRPGCEGPGKQTRPKCFRRPMMGAHWCHGLFLPLQAGPDDPHRTHSIRRLHHPARFHFSLSLLPTPSPPNPTLPIPHSPSHRTLLTNRPAGEGKKK